MSENRKVLRAAGLVGSLTLVSRILGMIRDVVLAGLFGASWAADAFYIAVRIPNTLRRFFGEGTLTVSTVPVLREIRRSQGDAAAMKVAQHTWWMLLLVLVNVALIGSLAAPLLIRVLAPGFTDDPAQLELASHLLSITFPYIVLIGMVGLAHGILNAFDHFFAPAFHPTLYNLALIFGAYGLVHVANPPIEGMAWAVLLGGVLQLVLHIPYLRRAGFSFRFAIDVADTGMQKILRLMGPAAFGVAIYQANIFVGTILASTLQAGSVTWLYFADRLFQLPLGIFVIALGTAVLPTFSSQAREGRTRDLEHTLSNSLRGVFFVTIPSAVGLFMLSLPVVAVLFQRQAFEATDSAATAWALEMYVLGLVPVATSRILSQVFYASQNTRTPVAIAAASFAVNLVLSLLLMAPLAHAGLALATSLAAWFQLVVTFVVARRRYIPQVPMGELVMCSVRTVLACVPMAAVLWWVNQRVDWTATGFSMHSVAWLAVGIVTGGLAYLATQWALRAPELRVFVAALDRRVGHGQGSRDEAP